MSVGASALTSLADVRQYLQRRGDTIDGDDTAVIESLITAWSDAIIQWTGREFAPVTSSATRTFAYDGSGVLSLAPYDLASLTSVVVDSDTNPTTLTSDQYRLRPATPRYGVRTHIFLSGWTDSGYLTQTVRGESYGSRYSEVQVTGAWGFPTVPSNVSLAATMQVAFMFRADVAAFARAFDPSAQVFSGGDGLVPAVKQLLYGFKHNRAA